MPPIEWKSNNMVWYTYKGLVSAESKMASTLLNNERELFWEYLHEFIVAEWRLYASVNKAIIGSNKGLPPIRHQAII